MKKILFVILIFALNLNAQVRKSREITFDLLNTELHLKPDFGSKTMAGKAILTLKPYFYAQSKLELDARGFDLKSVKSQNQSLEYKYADDIISINLGKSYSSTDTLEIIIEYISQPEKLIASGSEAITSDKGLYFIVPGSETPKLPTQLWTQGETQSNSVWFPTIDSPNQNHTQDIYLTLDKAMTTLSNGVLVETKINKEGTKTDHWKLETPHAVYLSMLAAGNFKKVIDSTFKRFEVSYYVEPEYEKNAYEIFGRTPEMIGFFEKLLGVKYQWPKYSQIPVRKYVSGAMENTTATVHSRSVLKDGNQIIDGNDDGVIAHELFHHWFGNLVTCESWSHLPLNESFANYSEFLWAFHKNGKEEADYLYLTALQEYMQESAQKQVPMIRFDFQSQEDMFDAHSYQKGGRILHQLRMEVGDEAFFKTLNYYLNKHAHHTTEIENLRLAFEKITGRDLKWFFDQWFFRPGHPNILASHKIEKNKIQFVLKQITDSTNAFVYNLKIPVEIYTSKGRKTEILEFSQAEKNYEIDFEGDYKGLLINPDGYLLAAISHQKTEDELIFQFQNSQTVYGRLHALENLTYKPDESTEIQPLQNKKVRELVLEALKDPFWRIREIAVQKFFDYDGEDFLKVEKALQQIIKNDPKTNVKATAILAVKNFLNPQNDILFREALSDSSNLVKASALEALFANNVPDAAELANKYSTSKDFNIFMAVASFFSQNPESEKYPWFLEKLSDMEGFELYQGVTALGAFLIKADTELVQKSVPYLKSIGQNETEWYVRMSAVRALSMLADSAIEAETAMKDIISKEKNARLMEYYEQFKK
ncbi:MAG: peptidase M1 [Cytophagaceae bacterium]|nr:peptidase M1 [Cytophagaceae bacterium]